jgi:hypothetical protein
MEVGFIKLFRKFKSWEWYDDIPTKTLFIHLMLSANFKTVNYRGDTIVRGTLITGRIKLSKETGLTETQIRRAMSNLQKSQEITIKTTNRYSVITLNNYDRYQQTTSQPPASDPTSNQQTTTIKEVQQRKEEKKQDSDFEKFWESYEKKTDRSKCEKKWDKIKREDKEKIFASIGEYVKSTPESQYRKNPLTWLNGECWNDEIVQAKIQKTLPTGFY